MWKWSLALLLFVHEAAFGKAFIATPGAQKDSDQTITPWIGPSLFYGVEAGVKAGWLIAQPGFVPMINNSVLLEGSVAVSESGHLFVAPLLQWNFHMHPHWTIYGEAGAELGTGFGKKKKDENGDLEVVNPRRGTRDSGVVGQFGAWWRFQPELFLRLEHDFSHQAFRVGLTFPW